MEVCDVSRRFRWSISEHASHFVSKPNLVLPRSISVADVRVEHEVKMMDFTKWLERPGGSPREVSDRHKIRSILGMPVARV
jgi:hypothetical protein